MAAYRKLGRRLKYATICLVCLIFYSAYLKMQDGEIDFEDYLRDVTVTVSESPGIVIISSYLVMKKTASQKAGKIGR